MIASMKLRPRIALVSCLVALFSVGVTGALLIRQSRAYSAEQLSQRQVLLVQNRAFALGDSVQLATRELVRLSHMAEVDLTDNDLRPEATLLAHAHRNSTLFNIGLQILDASGRCLWSEPAATECAGREYGGEPWLIAGRRASEPVVMGERPERGLTLVNLVVPIGGKPGAADGVLRGIIDLRSDKIISPAITEGLPAGTEAALVTRDGSVVFPGQLERGEGWQRAIAAPAANKSGTFIASERGEHWLYAYAPVAHAPWGLAFRWRYSSLDKSLEQQLWLLLEILAAGGALAVLLGLLSSRFLTRPLEALVRAVRELGAARARGEAMPAQASEVAHRSDELGELAHAFDELRMKLAEGDELHRSDLLRIRDLASSLEERVGARTAELEAAQRSLLAQERLAAMGQAAAAISHELKNSLGALGMGVDLIAAQASASGLQRAHAQIREEIARLRAMTDELLVFARSPRIDAQPIDVQQTVRRALSLCAERAASAQVALTLDLAEGGAALVVPCDEARIQSVLVNLVHNAIEAVLWSPAPRPLREVRVGTARSSGWALIRIEDSGPGLNEEARAHLFEPFFTTKRNGTGLGLATAQRFVVAHGGQIRLERSELGGARFVIELPLRAARPAEAAA
jgi:signal transduction histidine kinase